MSTTAPQELAASIVATCKHCPHSSRVHDSDGSCLADECGCAGMDIGETAVVIEPTLIRPVEPEPSVRGERPPTLESILQAGKRSEYKRTVTLTEKIAVLISDLRGRLADEREVAAEKARQEQEDAAARAEVERLQRQLAEAKAKLTKRPAATASPTPRVPQKPQGDGRCPECGKEGLTNVGAHRTKAHGFRRAVAS